MGYLFKKFTAWNWISIFVIVLLTLVQVYFTMAVVACVNELMSVVQRGIVDEIWKNGFWMILSALLLAIAQTVISIIASATASSIVTRTRNELYQKINALSLADMAGFSTESLITRTTNDIQNVHLAFLTALRTVFVAPITMVWSIILLVQTGVAELTIGTIIWLVLLVVAVIFLILLVIPKYKAVQRLTDALNVASRENLTGIRVVRAFNAERYQEEKFEKVNVEFTKKQIFVAKALAFFTPFVMFVMMGLTLTILWIACIILHGNATMEQATAAFAATNSFVMLASQIVMGFILLISIILLWPRATVSARRIREVLTHLESIVDPENPEEFKEEGTIEFRDVGYAYPGADKESVSHISFKVKKGETIAFIGATGSGKTTIINMIPRFADATTGEVFVDGVNVKNVRQEDLRNKIGYTPQRGFLFKGNIRENIAFSNPEMTMQDVKKAADIACASEFVESKREQYESEVAQGGTNFSGGQKQRLCIARSVAKFPEILIFDDSFSALDYRTDKVVRQNIKESMPGVTRVIIAQRVGTIMDADQIVVLDKGEMVGLGKHEDLVRNCPVYQEIALSQLSKEELGLAPKQAAAKGGN
ncbi:MAG: ABC transporter ATP-binding protein [Bacilli bacterium]|nr:ABC transporter ATP-binding protein [Bacilli bacterium]